MNEKETEEPSYEDAYRQLEEIVSRLEEDEPTLDELVKDYEKGMGLLKTCHRHLNEAALRIERVRAGGDLVLEPFEEDGPADGAPQP
ncbi:MAG: exodeoxyribonuclease VII small subunit [Puniceicoccaceae bacterium]